MHTVQFKEEAKRGQTWTEWLLNKAVPRKKHTVIFWDSPEVMPLNRYQAYNRHFMTQIGIGSTYEDCVKHSNRALGYIGSKDYKSASQELKNQKQCIWNALTPYSPKALAGAALIYSIDGAECPNYDDDSLTETLQKLTDIGFSFEMFDNAVDLVKKK
jgi:hypothetical protein